MVEKVPIYEMTSPKCGEVYTIYQFEYSGKYITCDCGKHLIYKPLIKQAEEEKKQN